MKELTEDMIGKTLYTRNNYEARVLGVLHDCYGMAQFIGAYRHHETAEWTATQWRSNGNWLSLRGPEHYLDLMLPRRKVWIFWDQIEKTSDPAIFFTEEDAFKYRDKNRTMTMCIYDEPE